MGQVGSEDAEIFWGGVAHKFVELHQRLAQGGKDGGYGVSVWINVGLAPMLP